MHPSLNRDEAIAEASRCLLCDDVCNICVGVCPNFSNVTFEAAPEKIPIYKLERRGTEVINIIDGYFTVNQKPQIFNIGDFCNECGNCNTFCPTSDAPYLTKPKFYLTEESFTNEDDCYYLNDNILIYKNNVQSHKVIIENDSYIYESNEVKIEFNSVDYKVTNINVKSDEFSSIRFEKASEMIYLLNNLINNSVLQAK